jgi:hypothetical protein
MVHKDEPPKTGQNEVSGEIIPLDGFDEIKSFLGEVSEFEKDRRKMLQDIQRAVSSFKDKYGIKKLEIYCVNMAGIDIWETNPLSLPRKRILKSSPQGKKTAPDF